jgi:hypothetical protein
MALIKAGHEMGAGLIGIIGIGFFVFTVYLAFVLGGVIGAIYLGIGFIAATMLGAKDPLYRPGIFNQMPFGMAFYIVSALWPIYVLFALSETN